MDQFTRILGALEHPPEIVERLNLSFSVPFVTPESTFGRSRCDALAAYRAHAVEMNRSTQDALSISAWFAREFASARSSRNSCAVSGANSRGAFIPIEETE
jgi:hypothetical protein